MMEEYIMDHQILKESIVNAENNSDFDLILSNDKKREVIDDMINFTSKKDQNNERGHRNLIIAMEELSELTKEISKSLRDEHDRLGLMEEIVDVEHVILTLCNVFNISDDELNKIRYVKTKRIIDRIDSGEFH